ncbi:unnamed protein product [Bodo saltans]|uniref:Uncharacterized protein n=1 Tax=Bodo saltans TaxID=75058 RepID=A0A0S4J0P8_BODSA|nr:unnamed protein product [Bodo saltans]|eukprot:CUG76810.1 unnamed protein product [Bodo saltans]
MIPPQAQTVQSPHAQPPRLVQQQLQRWFKPRDPQPDTNEAPSQTITSESSHPDNFRTLTLSAEEAEKVEALKLIWDQRLPRFPVGVDWMAEDTTADDSFGSAASTGSPRGVRGPSRRQWMDVCNVIPILFGTSQGARGIRSTIGTRTSCPAESVYNLEKRRNRCPSHSTSATDADDIGLHPPTHSDGDSVAPGFRFRSTHRRLGEAKKGASQCDSRSCYSNRLFRGTIPCGKNDRQGRSLYTACCSAGRTLPTGVPGGVGRGRQRRLPVSATHGAGAGEQSDDHQRCTEGDRPKFMPPLDQAWRSPTSRNAGRFQSVLDAPQQALYGSSPVQVSRVGHLEFSRSTRTLCRGHKPLANKYKMPVPPKHSHGHCT